MVIEIRLTQVMIAVTIFASIMCIHVITSLVQQNTCSAKLLRTCNENVIVSHESYICKPALIWCTGTLGPLHNGTSRVLVACEVPINDSAALTTALWVRREKLRFPSGTATAQIIRTLFGIDPDEPLEAVANMRTGAGPTARTATVQVPPPPLS